MIEIISVNIEPVAIRTYRDPKPIVVGCKIGVSFILFDKIVCKLEFETQDLELNIKTHVEKMLREGFNNTAVTQLEGKPRNLKTK